MKSLPKKLVGLAARQSIKVRKVSPTILFGVGVVGIIGAGVLACRATLKANKVLEEAKDDIKLVRSVEAQNDYSEKDRTQDMAKIYARTAGSLVRMYSPSVLIALASIGSLTGSHVMLNRRNVALTAAYAAVDRAFREYRMRVGPEKDAEYRSGDSEHCEIEYKDDKGKTQKKTVQKVQGLTADPYTYCFDASNRNWQRGPFYNQTFLASMQAYANDKLRAQGHLFLNEVLDMLGADRSKAGAVVGWVLNSKNGDSWVDFGVFEGDRDSGMEFVLGIEDSIWLSFNVDGVIYDKI